MIPTVSIDDIRHRRQTCLNQAAWADRREQTVIELTGSDRIDLLHRLTTNDLRAIAPGSGRQTVLLTDKARIIDVVTLLQEEASTLLIGSPQASSDIIQWVRKYVIMDDVRLRDRSTEFDAIEVMGPRASDIVGQLTEIDVSPFAIAQWTALDTPAGMLRIVRMPSPSEVSFWILGSHDAVDALRRHLQATSQQLPELSADDLEAIRVLAGMGRRGHEWTLSYNPLEAGLLHLTSFVKGCYIGQEVVARLDSYNKVKQRIMGLISPLPLSQDDQIIAEGAAVGLITSVVSGLDGTCWYALGYVRGEYAHAGTLIEVVHHGSSVRCELVLPPMTDASCR
jgi:folate-binding protein YgfZ